MTENADRMAVPPEMLTALRALVAEAEHEEGPSTALVEGVRRFLAEHVPSPDAPDRERPDA